MPLTVFAQRQRKTSSSFFLVCFASIGRAAPGHARTIFETGNSLSISPGNRLAAERQVEVEEEKLVNSRAEKDAVARARKKTASILALTLEDRRALALRYIDSGGAATTYQADTATFKNVFERTAFTAWLRTTVAKMATV